MGGDERQSVSHSDAREVVVNLQEALSRLGDRQLTDEQVGLGLGMLDGFGTALSSDSQAVDALLVAIAYGLSFGPPVHVLTRGEPEALTLRYRWAPILTELGETVTLLTTDMTFKQLTEAYSGSVVIGSYVDFCSNYLTTHAARRRADYVNISRSWAVVTDIDFVLTDRGTEIVIITGGTDQSVRGRVGLRDYLKVYPYVTGLNGPPVMPVGAADIGTEPTHAHMKTAAVASAIDRQIQSMRVDESSGREQYYDMVEQVFAGVSATDITFRLFEREIRTTLDAGTPAGAVVAEFRPMFTNQPMTTGVDSSDGNRILSALMTEARELFTTRQDSFPEGQLDRFAARSLLSVAGHQWRLHLARLEETPPHLPIKYPIKNRLIEDYVRASKASTRTFLRHTAKQAMRYLAFADDSVIASEAALW